MLFLLRLQTQTMEGFLTPPVIRKARWRPLTIISTHTLMMRTSTPVTSPFRRLGSPFLLPLVRQTRIIARTGWLKWSTNMSVCTALYPGITETGQMAANLEEEFSTSIGVNIEEHAKSMLPAPITAEWMLPPRIRAGPPPVLSDRLTSGGQRKEGKGPVSVIQYA